MSKSKASGKGEVERAEGVLPKTHPNYIRTTDLSPTQTHSQFSNPLRHPGCSQRRFGEHRKSQAGGNQKSIAVNYKEEIGMKEAKEKRVKV